MSRNRTYLLDGQGIFFSSYGCSTGLERDKYKPLVKRVHSGGQEMPVEL
jgi:hypothetical protein